MSKVTIPFSFCISIKKLEASAESVGRLLLPGVVASAAPMAIVESKSVKKEGGDLLSGAILINQLQTNSSLEKSSYLV